MKPIEIIGKHSHALVFTELLEDLAQEQIQAMTNHEITSNSIVRIMPDVHAGKGSTIGTTIKLPQDFKDWKVSPNVVGVDVGCAIMMYKLNDKNIDLQRLDEVVNEFIPAGFNVHDTLFWFHGVPENFDLGFTKYAIDNLTFGLREKTKSRIHDSIGTLGGGNHFIELGTDENGDYWLSVHSGSRGLGVQVASHHQKVAIEELKAGAVDIEAVISQLKKEGRHGEIQATIEGLKKDFKLTSEMETLAYLQGEKLKDYLHDMRIAQEYAKRSRALMLDIIVEQMDFEVVDSFDSVHNFIEHDGLKDGIIRKGATSAKDGERLVIPLNMRDGSLICIGKGNEDWNESAPHGAGRMMSRSRAREELDLDEFKSQMDGVYTSSVGESTIDEAPDAYKPAEVIMSQIKETADIVHLVKPVYNFKSH